MASGSAGGCHWWQRERHRGQIYRKYGRILCKKSNTGFGDLFDLIDGNHLHLLLHLLLLLPDDF